MNSAAVEMLLQDAEGQLSNYSMLLDEAYKLIDGKPVTDEEVKAFYGYKPRSRELMEAGRISVKARDKYQAKKDLFTTLGFDVQGEELTRLMEREAEDTIFEDGGASEAEAIAKAIERHMEAFNKIAQPRARELYMKYNELIPKEQKPTGYPMDDTIRGVDNIAKYIGMAKSTCQRALKMGEIPGTWQDGSRWKMSISKYESLKFNKQ